MTTIDKLHRPVLLGGGEGGGILTSKCPVKTRHIHLLASVPVLPVGQPKLTQVHHHCSIAPMVTTA